MLQPIELPLEQLGDRAGVIPGQEPRLKVSIPRIPVSELDLERTIIPVCEPTLAGNENRYVMDCLNTGWISSAGKYIPLFEQAFSRQVGCAYGIACVSGTTALHLILAALGLGPGDEVIIPTFTMIATAYAVSYTGARPVLVDSERHTWNMDIGQIEAKISDRTRAIVVVHTYGHPVDMDAVLEIARRHHLYVVEDAAEAHGATYKGRLAGSLGDAAAFSFYANKIITTGEGGMVTTNNLQLAETVRTLRDHAFSKERHFWHKYMGYSFRMTNLQAAVGLAQTEQMAGFVARRRENAALYTELLRGLPGLRLPAEEPWAQNVYWMYGMLVEDEFGLSRDELRRCLAEQGIETRTFFIPMHLQPIYYGDYRGERYPVAEDLCRRGLYLPSASSLGRNEIAYVVEAVEACRKRNHERQAAVAG
jgi:perosamine synthetase